MNPVNSPLRFPFNVTKLRNYYEGFWLNDTFFLVERYLSLVLVLITKLVFNICDKKSEKAPEHCALWLFPYRTIDFDSLNTVRPRKTSRQFHFLKDVFQATKRPAFVRQTVEKFLVKSEMKDFLAIHWRYSKATIEKSSNFFVY